MTLYSPDGPNQIDLTQPHLHALVIGVGDYPHLMGGAGHPAVSNFGLQQLTTTRLTAIRVVEWLAASYRNPTCSIGSIELLLSPAEQLIRSDQTQVAIEVSSMKNIKDAFERWRVRCNAQQGNIAFFYFAGHGISTASQYLLAADFGDPNLGNLWANCIDFDGLRVGMRANAADTQLFFVDACREKPIDALIQLNPNGDHLCSSGLFDQVAASAAYYAAADGRQAYGPATDITFFCTAVLEALQGAGAINKGGKWTVDTFTLSNAIGQIIGSLAKVNKQPLSCNPDPDGIPAAVHFPSAAIVRVAIGCQSIQANAEAEIRLQRLAVSLLSPPGDPRPWTGRVEPGDWDIQMTFQNFPAVARRETMLPPVFELEESV
jgi:hypothetical protein